MVNLVNARDTFLRFLADNLSGIEIHPLRKSTTEVGTDTFKANALNVEFLGVYATYKSTATQDVILTVIHEDENTAAGWIQSIYNLLSSAFYAPMMDYTVPASPVAAKGNVSWESSLTFRPIYNKSVARYECALGLDFIQ